MNRAEKVAKQLEEMEKIRRDLQDRLSQQDLSDKELKKLLTSLKRIYRQIDVMKV